MKGVPVRLEIGPRDIENNQCVLVRRDTLEKEIVSLDNVNKRIAELLEEIQKNMFKMAEENTKKKTTVAKKILMKIKDMLKQCGVVVVNVKKKFMS